MPRSLALAISVGVVSAGVLGLLLGIAEEEELEFVDGPSISITTDAEQYAPGMPIEITVLNSGTMPLLSPDGSFSIIVKALDSMPIYEVPVQEAARLEPGQVASFLWYQMKGDGKQVLQGVYRIDVSAIADDGTTVGDVAVIQILG